MKLNAHQTAVLPTATKSIANTSQNQAKPTQAAKTMQQRSPEPLHHAAGDFGITTREDGAVLATLSATDSKGWPISDAVTLVPPSTQTTGVKTIVMTARAQYGAPVFKITPFTFETMDGDKVAFGDESYPVDNVPPAAKLPVVAALRLQDEFVPGDAYAGPGSDEMHTYTIRVIDSVITLDDGLQPFYTLSPSQTAAAIGSSITPTITSSISPTITSSVAASTANAAVAGGRIGLSKGEVAGIGGGAAGLALLLGVGAALLYRRSQVAKRAAKSEEFAMKVLPNLNPAAFTNV